MALRREPQLTDNELRIVRGMIDEYVYHEQRDRFLRNTWKSGRMIAIAAGGVALFLMQVASTAYLILGHH